MSAILKPLCSINSPLLILTEGFPTSSAVKAYGPLKTPDVPATYSHGPQRTRMCVCVLLFWCVCVCTSLSAHVCVSWKSAGSWCPLSPVSRLSVCVCVCTPVLVCYITWAAQLCYGGCVWCGLGKTGRGRVVCIVWVRMVCVCSLRRKCFRLFLIVCFFTESTS